MRYADFKKLGMFTGSGAIEGGIKAIVVQRAKQSGMRWTSASCRTGPRSARPPPGPQPPASRPRRGTGWQGVSLDVLLGPVDTASRAPLT